MPDTPRARPVRPIKDDPFADVPAYDPDAPNPAATALTIPEPDDELTVEALKDKLRGYAKELLTGSPARLKQLPLEIQRVRSAMQLLTEADSGAADPDTYKELSMLNRMVAGDDSLDDPSGDEVAQAQAEELLLTRNINPDRARRMLRALEAMNAAPEDDRAGAESGVAAIERGRRRSTH